MKWRSNKRTIDRRKFKRQLDELTDHGLIDRIAANRDYSNMPAHEIIQTIIADTGMDIATLPDDYSFQPGFNAKGDLEEVSLVKNQK